MKKVHALAKCAGKAFPYVGMYLTQLETGQGLNQHRDYRNHEHYLNYTINFGIYEGGYLEMLRGEEWQSCAVSLVWVEVTADITQHRVREVTSGTRFSATLFTPSYLERLSLQDWMNLESFGLMLYSERDSLQSTSQTLEVSTVSGQVPEEPSLSETAPMNLSAMASEPEKGHVIQKVEK